MQRSASLLAWVLAFGLAAVWIPSPGRDAALAAPDAAGPPDIEVDLPSSSGFEFDCRVVTFPASDISFIRIWDDVPPDSVSARDAGVVRVERDRVSVYGREASYRPVDARLGLPLIIDLEDRRRVVLDDWVEKPGGGFAGFSYRVSAGSVYLDVQAGTEIYRGLVADSGFWPPADLTPGDDSIEMEICPADPMTDELSFTNGGAVPVSALLAMGPSTGAESPEACERFAVRVRDESTRSTVFDGPLCDLVDGVVPLAEHVAPGDAATAVVEVRTRRATPLDDTAQAPVSNAVAVSARVQWRSDPSPDRRGLWESTPWSWTFEVGFEGSPGPPAGFVTFTESAESDEPAGSAEEYRVIWPAFITDPPAVEVSESGLVCPVVGAMPFGDTWGELRGSTRFHLGVDIPAAQGNPLVAIEGGLVHRTMSVLGGYGLLIDAGAGKTYYYAHLSGYAEGLEDGSRVEAGTVVGFVGSTGNAAGPHLHLGLTVDGVPTNPYPTAEAACSRTTGSDEPPAEEVPGTASVSGHVRYDIDRNGDAASEPGIAGIHVELIEVGVGVVAADVTGPTGAFRLGPVEPGTYRVRFRAPDGWAYTRRPEDGALGGDVAGIRTDDGRLMGYTAPFDLEPDGTFSVDATLAPGGSAGGTGAP